MKNIIFLRLQRQTWFFLFATLLACGGPPPTMQGREGMLSKTGIRHQCSSASKDHLKPFVVEWDATDLASFEANAARDTLFVKYDGCNIQVMYECSDPSVAAKFGAYGVPNFTSGTLQKMDIRNEGELFAKLPLGASSLGGRIAAGEELHLFYYVSGVAISSRSRVYRSELAAYEDCAQATHFVWSYSLGAFELANSEQLSGEVALAFGQVSAGGSRRQEQSSLGRGGELASCKSNDQRACKVPIRLGLRAIKRGQPVASEAGQQQVVVGGSKLTMADVNSGDAHNRTAVGKAALLLREAEKKKAQGDGAMCLGLIDQARNLSAAVTEQSAISRSICQMMAGDCDAGKIAYRQTMAAQDTERRKTDKELDAQSTTIANHVCPSSSANNNVDYIIRAAREMNASRRDKRVKTCEGLFKRIEKKMKQLKAGPTEVRAKSVGGTALEIGAMCVAEHKSCAQGLQLYKRSYRHKLSSATNTDSIAEGAWQTLQKIGALNCK